MPESPLELLPLFPLGTVLFPGVVLPLHIFEPRYRALVQDLVDRPDGEGARRFGVVGIKQGREVGDQGAEELYTVGCTAELRQVEAFEDGRFAVVTVGGQRFQTRRLDHDSKPYLQAEVELLEDRLAAEGQPEDEVAVLGGSVADAFRSYLEAVGEARGESLGDPELPSEPLLLAYLVAATVLVDPAGKQELLAAPDTETRLRLELTLLRQEVRLLRVVSSAPATELTRQPYSPN